MKPNTTNNGVTVIDVVLSFLFFMLTFFIFQSWASTLASGFLLTSGIVLVLYIVGFITGTMSFLSVTNRPGAWTIGYIVGIPLWVIVNTFTPLGSSASTTVTTDLQSFLINLIGVQAFNYLTQVPVVVWGETVLLVGIVIVVFNAGVRDTAPAKFGNFRRPEGSNNQVNLLTILVGMLGGLVHYAIASILALSNESSFGIFLIHQILSFFIFTVISVLFGLGAGVSSHWVKNQLVFGTPLTFVLGLALCLLIDYLSAKRANRSNPQQAVFKSAGLSKYI